MQTSNDFITYIVSRRRVQGKWSSEAGPPPLYCEDGLCCTTMAKNGHKWPKWRQNFTTMGRKCPTAKTKTVLKSVNKMEQHVGMSKSKFRNLLK